MSNPNAPATRERHGFRNALIVVGLAVGGLAIADHQGAIDINLDNPFKQDNTEQPTVQELFEQANQDCANESAEEVVSDISAEDIAKADSIAKLTADANAEAATLTDACLVEATGIPVGTPGFEFNHPSVAVSGSAAVVQG